ncbi:TPA: hypothetical protein ACGSA8_004630, partial [Escherichia coli]
SRQAAVVHDTKSRLEDMMRELTHRHNLNKQPYKTQHVHH